MNVLEMINMQNMIDSYKSHPDFFDCFELEEIANSHLLIDYCHSKSFQAKLQVRFYHLKELNKYPSSVLFMMASESCHASVALDNEGARLACLYLKINLANR